MKSSFLFSCKGRGYARKIIELPPQSTLTPGLSFHSFGSGNTCSTFRLNPDTPLFS